jgi:CheY-like chemotaxis protein
MDAATQAHIFEPFFTTKETGKGTGLGLATTYAIVTQSQGHIRVQSAPGCGAAFRIYLPAIDHARRLHRTSTGIGTTAPEGSETILLVEDEEAVRRLVRTMLQSQGYNVLEAVDGHTALDLVAARSGPIHGVVTDVVMPKMSGVELAERLVLLRPEIRVLYISGYAETALARHGLAGESVAYLQKPFTPDDLARKMREVLRGDWGAETGDRPAENVS